MFTRSIGLPLGLAFVGSVALAACGSVVVEPSDTSTSTGEGGATTTTTTTTSTSTTTTTTTSTPPTAEEACTAYWDVRCTQMATCGPGSAAAFVGDHATCMATMAPSCVNDLTAPGTHTDTAKTLACAQAIASLTCTEFVQYLQHEIEVDNCAVPPGELPLGAACGSGGQCASSVCDVPYGELCGHCRSGELGTSCIGHYDSCKMGLRCNDAGTCVPVGKLGDPCGPNAPCGTAFACVDGQCSPPSPPGGKCDPKSFFSGCTPGHICIPSTGLCQVVDAVPPGFACGFVDDTFHYCAKGSFCVDNWPMKDVCVPTVAEGEPCSKFDDGNSLCDYPRKCIEGICRYPDPSMCQ